MQFRSARHTNDLTRITQFYTQIIGLEVLGSLENHDRYDGIFLGRPNSDWHLEFTASPDEAAHHPDEDDLLVFYFSSRVELEALKERLVQHQVKLHPSKNPYWQANGIEVKDPDGFGIVLSLRPPILSASNPLPRMVQQQSINNWSDLLDFVRALPYGRNSRKDDLSLVLSENKGTCSSKHALVKQLALNNHIPNVELQLVLFKMNKRNTPKLTAILEQYRLDYLPEAHCYLKVNGQIIDLTN